MGMSEQRAENGFTLVEVLIALVILSVGLAGLIPALINTVHGNTFGDTTTQTATYSQDKLEELRRMPFDDLCAAAGSDTLLSGVFAREWRVAPASGAGACADADVVVIEVCTAEASAFSNRCFSASPVSTHHFLAIRADF